MSDRIINPDEAARKLGVSIRTLQRMGGLPKVQISARRVGYVESKLDGWIADRLILAEAA